MIEPMSVVSPPQTEMVSISTKRKGETVHTPIVMSLDDAKSQYIKTPMNEEYKPYSGSSWLVQLQNDDGTDSDSCPEGLVSVYHCFSRDSHLPRDSQSAIVHCNTRSNG